MRKGDKRVFKDKQFLYRMVNLRLNGWTTPFIANLYNCDVSSVRDRLDQYQIEPLDITYKFPDIIRVCLEQYKEAQPKVSWARVRGEGGLKDERVCMGRSYADYFPKLSPLNKRRKSRIV